MNRKLTFRELALNVKQKVQITLAFQSHEVTKHVIKRRLENTYQVSPSPRNTYKHGKVSMVIENVLQENLQQVEYDEKKCANLCCFLAGKIKDEMKKLDFNRHKIVCHVVIGQKQGQDILSGSRSLLLEETDGFGQGEFVNDSLMASAFVYGLYYD